MPLQSDLTINYAKFDPSSESNATTNFNNQLIEIGSKGPNWYEVGADKYRRMRWNGETPAPKPVVLKDGKKVMVPSREAGREIPCRVFEPANRVPSGVFMHIHGGGWVLQSEEYQDEYLKYISDCANLTVVSVGYRLAPDNAFPKGPEDCYDVAEWLVDNAKQAYGAELLFVGGESAGGHLSALTCFHLIRTRPKFEFKGLVLFCGAYDISILLPQVHQFDKELFLWYDIMIKYLEAFLPNTTAEQRMDPSISPLFENMRRLAKTTPSGRLPPAFFGCGTEDPLLDDTMFMSTKWMMSGAEASVKIYPGAPHVFHIFNPKDFALAGDGREDMKTFMLEKMQ